ncbi:hypothetical protein QBC34DRAFT_455603 [Podospora aff. communis PSN243]|uniref:F-box domain-containing protein n=1 Tax=Podospora aff. communis PSN243 TaxID=3040156 RepID=A0AAV9GZR8_9PEZI|nr:hypothetical protein QBC34DRAFT_455603 [Podospora aff. communis PSN243]
MPSSEAGGEGSDELALVRFVDPDAPPSSPPRPITDPEGELRIQAGNPWYCFNFFDEAAAVSDHDNGPSILSTIPPELLLMIAERLPTKSALALARTSRRMRDIVKQILPPSKFNYVVEFNLCLLMERESVDLIACPYCATLHGSTRRQCPTRSTGSARLYFPYRNFCRFFYRDFLRNMQHLPDREISEPCEVPDATFQTVLRYFKRRTVSHVRAGRRGLLLRTQTVIAPFDPQEGITTDACRLMRRCLHGSEVAYVCKHLTMRTAMERNFMDWGKYPYRRHRRPAVWLGHSQYSGNGPLGDSTRKVVRYLFGDNMLHELFSEKPAAKTRVWGCFECETDFCVNFLDVEGIGRVIVFTKWNDLGGPSSKSGWNWQEQGRQEVPSVSLEFEGIEKKGDADENHWVSSYARYHAGAAEGFLYEPLVDKEVFNQPYSSKYGPDYID